MKSLLPVLCLCVITVGLVGFDSLSANWNPPPSTPPSNNILPPINIGTTTQVKDGNIGARVLQAQTAVWSNQYCDAMGANCSPPGSSGTISPVFRPNGGYTWSGGMLYQWGTVCPSGSEYIYNFHIPFPTLLFSVTGSPNIYHPGATRAAFNVERVSNSQFRTGTLLSSCINWLAIGY